MELSINKIRCCVAGLHQFMQKSEHLLITDAQILERFLNKEQYGNKDLDILFGFLSTQLLMEKYTIPIGIYFKQYLPLFIAVAIPNDEKIDSNNFVSYQQKCIALAKLTHVSQDAKGYASLYFQNKPPPFINHENHSATPQSKKSRIHETTSWDSLALIKCLYQLLQIDPDYYKELWNWTPFVEYYLLNNKSPDHLQLYINHILAILTSMPATQLRQLNLSIPVEVLLAFDEEQILNINLHTTTNDSVSLPIDQVIEHKFKSQLVTNIEGVLLPIFSKQNFQFYMNTDGSYDKIVKVDSTKVNLRSIALGIASGKAICLNGPVGCGKTTLIEYLARKTGRICPKSQEIAMKHHALETGVANQLKEKQQQTNNEIIGTKRKVDAVDADKNLHIFNSDILDNDNVNGFLRIQLGDQTDSKMLLGQYRCTDVPGEFIWLPGVLTQAVMNGYWLLLEDLDSATQDTYTILSSLLEHNFLSVPGFRDCVKIEPGFQLFVTVRTNKSVNTSGPKSLVSLLEKYLYTINILPLSRNELCKVVSTNYPKLATVANRIVDVFLTFSRGAHDVADNLRRQETGDKADTTEQYASLPFEQISLSSLPNSGRLVSTRDLIKLCQRSNPMFSVTSTECAYFVFQNAVDVFCSYLPQGKDKTKLIIGIGAKLGIIQSRCEHFAIDYKPEVTVSRESIRVGRTELYTKGMNTIADLEHHNENDTENEVISMKRQKLNEQGEKKEFALKRQHTAKATFSFTRISSCILERISVCVANAEPVLLVGETGVGKTSSVQYLAERTQHSLVVVNMNNQSDVSDLVGGFKPVDLSYVIAPLRIEFEQLFCTTFNQLKNANFLNKFMICYNQGNFSVLVKLMLKIVATVNGKAERNELREKELDLLPRWESLKVKLLKLNSQLSKAINISFAFIPGSLVNCIKNGDWVLLDEINLATAETLECLSTILEPDGSVVLLEMGDFTPVKRHSDFRIFACMNPNTDIGKKDLPVGIRNRFTEFFVDELTTDADLSLLVSDYLSKTGIQRKSVTNIVKLYKKLKNMSKLELNDGLGNRPVFSLRTLCRSLRICAKNLCGSIERNLYESFCLSFLTQLDPLSHNIVLQLIKDALLCNAKAVLSQQLPKLGENYLDFEGYWIQQGPKTPEPCNNYILTESVKENLKDLARIISIGQLPILLQGPTSAGKTSLIEYVAKRSGNHCLRINNHEHTDLQEYIGTYAADVTGKLSFREGVLAQAMRNGYWIILDELNLASTDILEALNRVLDDNRELFIPETQTVIKAHPNFMLFATQNPPGLYGGRKTLSRAFKNRFIELHFAEIPRAELEIILEKRCLIPTSYSKKMVHCMSQLQMNRKTTTKNVFTLRDLFRWGNRYTFADEKLLADQKYDWNQHLIEEGYLVLSAKVRTAIEIEIIEETLYKNFRKRIDLNRLFDVNSMEQCSPVTRDILEAIAAFKLRNDIVWTRNMTRMAVLTAKALQFDEPVLLVGPTGCGKTTVCQLLAGIHGVKLRILNCHMHTEGADFLGGLRPCRQMTEKSQKLFEWADGPLISAMQEGSYFMADEISLAEDSVLERLNCILEPERTVLLAEKGGVAENLDNIDTMSIAKDFIVKAAKGFQFLATMNPGGDFGKKELSPALRNRFTEVWCLPSDSKEDLVQIASNCMLEQLQLKTNMQATQKIATYLVEVVVHIRDLVEKFKFSVRDILAWANYIVTNTQLSFAEQAIFGLETIFLDALEMLPHESLTQLETLKSSIINFAIEQAAVILNENFTLELLNSKRGTVVELTAESFGIKPFYIATNANRKISQDKQFLFEAPTTKQNLFRLLSALSLKKPVLLEGPPGVGKTSIVESIAHVIGYEIVRINLCEHTDLSDLFGTDLPAEDNALSVDGHEEFESTPNQRVGSFVWRDGPLLAALKTPNTWILLDELNLAPQSVLEGLNAILDHRGEVYIPELNKTFTLSQETRIFACQNPLKQGGGRKGLPQSFLNRFNKVYLRKLSSEDLLYVVNAKYSDYFEELRTYFVNMVAELPINAENLFDVVKQAKTAEWEKGEEASVVDMRPQFDLAARLVKFSESLDMGIAAMEFGYKGGPFEINLRDILRWCDLLVNPETGFIAHEVHSTPCGSGLSNDKKGNQFISAFETFLLTLYERMKLVYYQRMRSEQDKLYIRNAFAAVFNCNAETLNDISEDVSLYWTDDRIFLNDIVLQRDTNQQILRALKQSGKAPLMLRSQREIFKNLIECIHMEKPVLLCGATDTGKTKLIDALCRLANQTCDTDTIDDSVTGSFQQIDLNRHLEEIAQNIEKTLMTYLQSVIINGTANATVLKVFNAWSDYCVASKTKIEFNNTTATAHELELFRQRIQNLNTVIDCLINAQPALTDYIAAALQQQQCLLNTLKVHIRAAESLNTGGSFEWVDSKIVKALKSGQYILLEHVNLCSSAVLDRLNPVFEPNGNLSISEKGVTANDSAEIVRKAPNFRAFLTIDPKNGELSRAMRNRCVELAMNKHAYTVDDMRAIVHAQGVLDIHAINCILRIHDSIVQLTEINNYSISQLTQFAFLTAAYTHIGYEMSEALYVSGMEVYVYAANLDLMGYGLAYYQNKLREIVLAETKLFAETATTLHYESVHLENVILKCSELNQHTLIKLQLEPLKVLLMSAPECVPQKQLSQLFSDFEKLQLEDIDRSLLLRYFVYMLYEVCSMDDAHLRSLCLQKLFLKDVQLMKLSERLYKCIKHFQKQFQPILSKLPWNSKLFPRIRDYATQLIKSTHHKAYCLSATMLAQLLLLDVPNETSNTTALGYSQAVCARQLPDKKKNVFLSQLSTFLTLLQNVLYSALQYAHFALPEFVQLITAYLWFNRLLNIAQQTLTADLLDKLVLHFKWLEKHLLSVLTKVLPNYRQLNGEFEHCLQQLTNHVLSIRHPLNLMRKVYAKQMAQFQPFYLEEQTQIYAVVQQLDEHLYIMPQYGSFTVETVLRKYVAQQSDAAKRARAISNQANIFQYTHYDYKFKETNFKEITAAQPIPRHLQLALQQFMSEIKEMDEITCAAFDVSDLATLQTLNTELQQSVKCQDKLISEQEKPKELMLGMQALKEYFLVKALQHKMSGYTSDNGAVNSEYCNDIHTLKFSTHCQLLNLLKSAKYKSFNILWRELTAFLKHIEKPEDFEALLSYMNGSYRHFTSYQRIIMKTLLELQLTQIATRLQCTQLSSLNADVDSCYVYDGPVCINVLLNVLCHSDGQLKTVAINDLDNWKSALQQLRQLVWHNSYVMSKYYSSLLLNVQLASNNAKRLLLELGYISKLCANMENENFSDYNDGFQKLTLALDSNSQQLRKAQISFTPHKNPAYDAQLYVELQFLSSMNFGLCAALELSLLTFTPLIDPIEKNRLKNLYIAEDINCLTTLTTVYDFMKIIMSYKHFGQEIYMGFNAQLRALRAKQEKLAQKMALRPANCLYSSLVQDINHFLKTNCEPLALNKLLLEARKAWDVLKAQVLTSAQIENVSETLKRLDLWIANSQRFVRHTMKPYQEYYQDFLQPLQCSIAQMQFGMEGLKTVLQQLQASMCEQSATKKLSININEAGQLHIILLNILEFPSCQRLQVFNSHGTQEVLQSRSAIFSLLQKVPGSEYAYFRLLKSKLIELNNCIKISNSISEQDFQALDFTFNICNQVWQQEEDRRRKQQAEQDSLYVTKKKCETEDEELIELQEIAENFPTNIEEDFGEFLVEDTLENVMKLDKQSQATNTKLSQVVRDDDYAFIAKSFIDIMLGYTQAYYHQNNREQFHYKELEFVEPFRQRLVVFTKLYNHYKASLNEAFDEQAYNSLCFAVGLQQHMLKEINLRNRSGKTYNFYKDGNIDEIIACTHVLDSIETRVLQQLELYPEHASLNDIQRVIARIRQLPATSPIVRYNTGFQILRQKVAQWNEVAHKGNHLRDEEVIIAEYVQKWTKLELQYWRNCLTDTYQQVEANAYKYWFFIYNLMKEYILEHDLDLSYTDIKYTEKRFGEGEVFDAAEMSNKTKITCHDVIKILRQFVECASYGDFHVRLQLLQAFELYLHNIQKLSKLQLKEEARLSLIAGLRNLQIYFSQFTVEIEDTKKSMKTPIEKKLKEFVKIESYNKDLSYFSMRNNVARVHRNLNKFLKEYRYQLTQKVTPVFQPKDATVKDYNLENDKGKELRHDSSIKYSLADIKYFLAPIKLREKYISNNALATDTADQQSLLQKVGKHFATSRNVVKETISNAQFPELIVALDLLFTQQLERCEHLRSLSVDRSKERPKQLLEAKQIVQQKRKGLTDLFKSLTQLGLNYKTGLLESSLRTEFENYQLPPFCVKTAISSLKEKRLHSYIVQLNENLDKYYAKCVFKLKLLQNIMLTPLSELGPPNIERIKGFAVDLFLLMQGQRQMLANTTKNIYDLRGMVQNLKEISDLISAEEIAPNALDFQSLSEQFNSLKDTVCHVRFVFEQFNINLLCIPSKLSEDTLVLVGSHVPLLKNTPTFNALSKACDSVLTQTKVLLNDMSKMNPEFVQFEKMQTLQRSHTELVNNIRQIREYFKCSNEAGISVYLPIAAPLTQLLELIAIKTNSPNTGASLHASDFSNADLELENIIHSILISLQKLFKKYPKSTPNASDEEEHNSPKRKITKTIDDLENEATIHEHHLKQKLYNELQVDWSLLNMPQIVRKLTNLMLTLKHSTPTMEKLIYTRKIVTLLPILEQYHLMADYYLFQQLSAHKVTVKMLSVMLTVFIEISTKGFCVPPDLMQDEDGQAKNEQNDGEGFGLEDGTGEKDASDKIESEDQLDDAKRPEDRKNDGDEKQDECKEEKGIEMSEDFEGEMQDIDKPENEEDDSGESENEEELNKEMGDTEEGAEKLDDQIWGDDEDEQQEEEEEKDMDEEEGKGTKDEKETHNDLDTKNDKSKDDGKTDQEKDGLDATNEPSGDEDKRKQQEKDIDNMKEPEIVEDQDNPYHNELEEPPEPEEMELGDMNNGADNEVDEDQQNDDDNPLDIDAMKENMQNPEESQEDETEKQTDTNKDEDASDGSDSEDEQDAGCENIENKQPNEEEHNDSDAKNDDDVPETQKRGDLNEEEKTEDAENPTDTEKPNEEKPEEFAQSKDKASNEDNVQSIPETEQQGSADQVDLNETKDQEVKQELKLDEQDTGEEKDGVGQAENEKNEGGHQGMAETKETVSNEERKQERQTEEKRKQGRTNEERTLGEAEEKKLKQLKTIDKLKEQTSNEEEAQNEDELKDVASEEYQHVKEPKSSDKTTLDNATEEQSKKIQHQEDEEQQNDDEKECETNDEPMEVDEAKDVDEDVEEMSAEKFDQKSDKPSKSEKTNERAETTEEQLEIEGEVVPTMNVPRSADTTAHCIKEILLETNTSAQETSAAESIELRRLYQQQLTTAKMTVPEHDDYETWQSISNRMSQNARELCEQLRLILEPTKCTRLKGDYRTGRRINMKKIIPYIASQFRKDKIWLRRTKPAQRDYKITIAIDDSKSMHHNNSKTLTLEAISLVSQALTLLESGRLIILSFGESPKIILNHTEQFDGPKLVNALNFSQDKTKIAELLDFTRTINTEEGSLSSDNGLFENLLLILSDGRNIFSEGKSKVKNAIKLARLQRMFLVYIIIDNPENKNSILDIQTVEVLPNKRIDIKSYLDEFPFPYYVIVRDLNQLPLVLSEAMRQWFELVNSEQ